MKNKQLLMLSKWALSIILPAVMLASCGADEIVEPTPQPPVDKCAARGDTTMVFATAADMNNKMTLVNEYLNCGKNVVCQIDFPMALSAEDLNGDYHWMQKSGIGVNFGASGYCYPANNDVLLTFENWNKLRQFKIGTGQNGDKFAVNRNEQDRFAEYADALHILNGNAAQTPKEVRDAAADAANATEPTTLYVAADMTVDADMLASLEAAAVNPNVSFEVVGAAGGLKPNGSKTNISKNLLSKTNGILKSGDKDGDIVYDYFYVRDLTRNDVPSGAPTIRTNKMDIGDMLESASMMSTLTKAGLTPMGGASTISAIIPDTTYWKRDNHLQDCSALSALQDWPYTIKVLLEYCQDLSGGVPAFGGVNDAILDIMGHEDSGHPLSTDKHPVLGKAFVSGQEGGATEVQQVGATKLEYGTGSHSAEKVIESTMSIQDGRSLKIHSFKRASLPIKFSEETRYRNTATLPTHGGGPVFQPGLVTLIYSSLLDSISNAPDKQISNSLGINLTIDATTTAIRISENDSIKWLSTLSADADVLPFLQNYMVLQMLSARGITVVNRYEDNNGNGTLLGDKHRSFYWYNPHDDAPFQNAVSYDSNATSSTGPSSTPQSSFDEKMMAKQRMEKKRMQAINRANTRGH